MPKKDQPILTEEQIAKNPAIDPKIVKEALQMRRELENLGVWEDSGSRVRKPPRSQTGFKSTRTKRKSAHHAEPIAPIDTETAAQGQNAHNLVAQASLPALRYSRKLFLSPTSFTGIDRSRARSRARFPAACQRAVRPVSTRQAGKAAPRRHALGGTEVTAWHSTRASTQSGKYLLAPPTAPTPINS